MHNRKIKFAAISALVAIGLSACTDADVASHNLSQAADMFQIKVIFKPSVIIPDIEIL